MGLLPPNPYMIDMKKYMQGYHHLAFAIYKET